ncbi:unnamed protein product [Mesocestoides corti]|uniref:Ovule protein n=1 Tax=Mesocestoides corti TaxID=53468 RepID=A0A0R3U6X8_MESCO|nr:unnamed protein product [Mesocestoides corti]
MATSDAITHTPLVRNPIGHTTTFIMAYKSTKFHSTSNFKRLKEFFDKMATKGLPSIKPYRAGLRRNSSFMIKRRQQDTNFLSASLLCTQIRLQSPVTHFRLQNHRPGSISAYPSTKLSDPLNKHVSRGIESTEAPKIKSGIQDNEVPATSFGRVKLSGEPGFVAPPPSPVEEDLNTHLSLPPNPSETQIKQVNVDLRKAQSTSEDWDLPAPVFDIIEKAFFDLSTHADNEIFHPKVEKPKSSISGTQNLDLDDKGTECGLKEHEDLNSIFRVSLTMSSLESTPTSRPPSQDVDNDNRLPSLSQKSILRRADGETNDHLNAPPEVRPAYSFTCFTQALSADTRKGVRFDVQRNSTHTYEKVHEQVLVNGARKAIFQRLRLQRILHR